MAADPWSRRRKLFSPPQEKTVEKPKKKWRILPIIWLAFKKTSMVVGAVMIISAIITAWSLSSVIEEIEPVRFPQKMVLYMELEGDIGDLPEQATITDPFTNNYKTLRNFIDAIHRARIDPRVQGIYTRFKMGGIGVSHVQEIRAAIKEFRESGKFAYIYAPSYNNGLGGYYLASAYDEIWMQPMGTVQMAGLHAEVPFAREALDKIGVKPQFYQRKEYKNAYESATHSEMSPETRESVGKMVDDIATSIQRDLAVEMDISDTQVKDLVDQGLFIGQEAVDSGLVDTLDYADVLVEKITEQVTGNPKSKDAIYVNFDVYMANMLKQKNKNNMMMANTSTQPKVALVYAVGAIMDTDGSGVEAPSVMVDDGIAAADEIAGALMDISYNDTIDAVVLRIDSPGGSPVASETILRAIEKVQESGKTVTVSMGATAASGGYWIATGADHIFALPTTLTGSIGVLGGKLSLKDLWAKLGVNWDSVSWGENAGMWSLNRPFTESEAERMNAMLDHIYTNFVARVAKGRDMSEGEVEEIAKGRVWTGLSGHKIGIVDTLGGLNDALDYAAKQAGAENRYGAEVIVLPRPRTPIEQLVALLEGQVRAGEWLGMQADILRQFQPLLTEYKMLKSTDTAAVYEPVQIQD